MQIQKNNFIQQTFDNSFVIKQTEDFVYKKLHGEGTGHDWYHIDRVRKIALKIAEKEKADLFLVELAALLHDVADWKFHNGDESVGPKVAKEWLESLFVDEKVIEQTCNIILNISFKGAHVNTKMKSLEGMIVQDADRIDALGAIGIARCFAYGGFKNNPIYDPNIKTVMHKDFQEYKSTRGSSINHFYEKLLLLKDRMNTKSGYEIAKERHEFMQQFLNQFFKEWDCKFY